MWRLKLGWRSSLGVLYRVFPGLKAKCAHLLHILFQGDCRCWKKAMLWTLAPVEIPFIHHSTFISVVSMSAVDHPKLAPVSVQLPIAAYQEVAIPPTAHQLTKSLSLSSPSAALLLSDSWPAVPCWAVQGYYSPDRVFAKLFPLPNPDSCLPYRIPLGVSAWTSVSGNVSIRANFQ